MARKKNYSVYQHFFVSHTSYFVFAAASVGGTFLLLALLTFYQGDHSPFYVSLSQGTFRNMGGAVGSFIASYLLHYCGYASYIIPLSLFSVALYASRHEDVRSHFDQCLGVVLLFFGSMPLCYVLGLTPVSYFLPGGLWGTAMYTVCARSFGAVITAMGISVFVSAGLILAFRVTFSELLKTAHLILVLMRVVTLHVLIPGYRFMTHVITQLIGVLNRALSLIWQKCFGKTVESHELNLYEFEQEYRLESETQSVSPQEIVQKNSDQGPVIRDLIQPLKTEHHIDNACDSKNIEKTPQKLFQLPLIDKLFHSVVSQSSSYEKQNGDALAQTLEQKLLKFGIKGKVVTIKPGPVVTIFEYQPEADTKVSRIVALEDDLALALEALSVRIIAPIPGTSRVGIEVANKERKAVYMNDIMRSAAFKNHKGALPFVLGKDTVGNSMVVDLADMPHLLVAGSTGSGKSVALNTLLVSLLCKLSPEQLKLVIIDPKRLEFTTYHDIPHLLFPVITQPTKAAPVLAWLVRVMEQRYELMAQRNVRNIGEYKKMCQKNNQKDDMPYIVVMIDELADLMIIARKEIEESIARLAQMARAAGIHLILATQRPSVDVLTGVIKVNFPSRMAFRVSSKIDSRTIIDTVGAEKLLGKGDMLFMDAHSAGIKRIHGAYVTDEEIESIVDFIKKQQKPEYIDLQEIITQHVNSQSKDNDDPMLDEVIKSLEYTDELSISSLQRKFSIGYNRSARIVEHLEALGYILPADGSKTRKVIK